ncbi:hypothetical protein EDD75_2212 [Thermodesulfitimonas autotrophica]|uniref:Copper amine oxidase-like protein n=1 Tax=Thermodesulfitimonas autotrophica TaxID=1894989 RepID=A0A3N5BD79_9THEO|nr:hypothetical protein [Thermodesulfitimonas autotrophica]RPF41991.1 hypothetical protein EDD75_2212 [Thermodesulfitimonas autotrophica]
MRQFLFVLAVVVALTAAAASFAFASGEPAGGFPGLPEVKAAGFQPGVPSVWLLVYQGGESFLVAETLSRPPELRNGRLFVPLDAVCIALDAADWFDFDNSEVVVCSNPEIRVKVSPAELDQAANGGPLPLVPLRETFEKQGWTVEWRDGIAVVSAPNPSGSDASPPKTDA